MRRGIAVVPASGRVPGRAPRLRVGVLAGLVLLLAVSVSGCGAERSRAAVSSHAQAASLTARHLQVRVPDGTLDVRLGKPVDAVGGKNPPSGWSYVPVGALLDASSNVIGAVKGVSWGVVADGRTVRLPTPYTKGGSDLSVRNSGTVTYVPVPDHGREVTVSVTYAGLTQTVSTSGKRVAGAAQAYYDGAAGTGGKTPVSGDWSTPPGQQLSVGGTIQATSSPYLPGQGWARAGHVFWGIDVSLQEVHASGDPLSVLELRPTLDGSGPLGATPAPSAGGVVGTYWFDVASGPKHVLDLTATYGGITGTRQVPFN